MRIPYTMTAENITVFHKGKVFNIPSTHRKFAELKEHLRQKEHDVEFVETVVNVRSMVERFSKGNVKIYGNDVFYKGKQVRSSITSRLIDHLDKGYEVDTWLNFMENVMQNPSDDSRERLFDFLEKNGSPMTEDGHFLTFKRVRGDFLDHYTGTMDNSPGKIVEVSRDRVNPDNTMTCSWGLHVCASVYLTESGYANSAGAKTIVCKVNPKDVVAVPPDYNETKMRVCRYEVISEVELGSIHEVEQQDVAFGYGEPSVFDDVDSRGEELIGVIKDYIRRSVTTENGEEYDIIITLDHLNQEIILNITGELGDFFKSPYVVANWIVGTSIMMDNVAIISGDYSEYEDYTIRVLVSDDDTYAELDSYGGVTEFRWEDEIEYTASDDMDIDDIASIAEDFYADNWPSQEDDECETDSDAYAYITEFGERLSERLGVEVFSSDYLSETGVVEITLDTSTRIDEVSVRNMVHFLEEFADEIYEELFNSEYDFEEVRIEFMDCSNIKDVVVFVWEDGALGVYNLDTSETTSGLTVEQAVKLHRVINGVAEQAVDEEELVFVSSSGVEYSASEVLGGIGDAGSLNQWARDQGLARSTVQGWVKKIINQ